jgi:hypothetical protein
MRSLAAHGFFAAHGLAAFTTQGFLALAEQGLAAFAAQGLAACATVGAVELACPDLTSELVHDAAVKASRQTAVLHDISSCLLRMTERIVSLLWLHGRQRIAWAECLICKRERRFSRIIPGGSSALNRVPSQIFI